MEIDAYTAFLYPSSTKGWFYYSLMYLLLLFGLSYDEKSNWNLLSMPLLVAYMPTY